MPKPTVQEVSGALRACGYYGNKRTRRENRPGFRVIDPQKRGLRTGGISVLADATDDPWTWSNNYAMCLEDKGFDVSRPFPDKTVLLVKRR
jgi:hypothetical protein